MKVYAVMDLSYYGDEIRGLFLNKQNAEKYIEKIMQSDDDYLDLFISEFSVLDA